MGVPTSRNTYLTFQAPAVVSVGNSSTPVLAADARRKFVELVNVSDESIALAFDGQAAVDGRGFVLTASGGSLTLTSTDARTIGAVAAICASGSKNLAVQEAR